MKETTRRNDNYFHETWQLTPPHSEVVSALPCLNGTQALDIGCGQGRNTLYLNQKGFEVTAWDNNVQSLAKLQHIMAAEQLSHIHPALHDLNTWRFNGNWDFVFSTVVMMFLLPETIPQLIADMQASTAKGGYNLIVAAMDTDDYPCHQPFTFTFKSGELSHYYRNWHIIKYNENVGQLHRVDEQGNRIALRFATLLARKHPAE
ncbi:tellurite resistance methyltransferase TehB [Enterobacteriaceae bacterium LUAb1]